MLKPLHASLLAASCVAFASCAVTSSSTAARPDARAGWSGRLPDPVSAGTTFESPVIESNLEAHVVHQNFPSDSIFGGGGFNLYALQARFAVSDRLAIIATKDGYIDLNPDAAVPDDEGLADIGGGVKYMAYSDPERGILVTPGLIFESSSGDEEVFQGNGDGVLRPFVTAGWDRGQTNLMAAAGYNHPFDDDAESASYDWHLHVSYEVTPQLMPLFELNGISYVSNGMAFPANFEGGDLINLGSTDVAGQTVVSGALGAAWCPTDSIQLGITYEWPLSSREDLLDDRIWFAALFRL